MRVRELSGRLWTVFLYFLEPRHLLHGENNGYQSEKCPTSKPKWSRNYFLKPKTQQKCSVKLVGDAVQVFHKTSNKPNIVSQSVLWSKKNVPNGFEDTLASFDALLQVVAMTSLSEQFSEF